MNIQKEAALPKLFRQLAELGCLQEDDVFAAADGFFAAKRSIADILGHRGITTVPGEHTAQLECRLFFDDWYLYAVCSGASVTYSLFKMREQEYDEKRGLHADGDVPGVTICFIELHTQLLLQCLSDPCEQNRKRLGDEINRVVAAGGQLHSESLKAYFVRTQAQGPYLIAKLYTEFIASLSSDGYLPVPERYAFDYKKSGLRGRIPRFLEENNKAAGAVVCDHEKLCISDPGCLSEPEQLAILATHTGNVSLYSFAAEVQFHARFLTRWAKIPLPFFGGSAYASAIRADMSIADAEFVGPTPYYRPGSKLVKNQYACHKDRIEREAAERNG